MPPPPPGPGQPSYTQYGYSTWEAGYHDLYEGSAGRGSADPLHSEKNLFFGIIAGFTGLRVLAVIVGAIAGNSAGGSSSAAAGYSGAFAVIDIVVELIYLWLIWFALYGTQLWAKWSCIGCAGLSMLSVFFMLLGAGTIITEAGLGQYASAVTSGLWFFVLLSLAFQGWFISILYRDVQQMQQR